MLIIITKKYEFFVSRQQQKQLSILFFFMTPAQTKHLASRPTDQVNWKDDNCAKIGPTSNTESQHRTRTAQYSTAHIQSNIEIGIVYIVTAIISMSNKHSCSMSCQKLLWKWCSIHTFGAALISQRAQHSMPPYLLSVHTHRFDIKCRSNEVPLLQTIVWVDSRSANNAQKSIDKYD